MVGDKEQKNPGIIPRAFNAMFDIMRENSSKFSFKVADIISPAYKQTMFGGKKTLLPFVPLFLVTVLPFRFQPICWSSTMTGCRTSLRARLVRPMYTLNPMARPGGWRSRGTERELCSPKEQRQKRLPVPRSSTLCSSRPAQTDTSLPPVSSRFRAKASNRVLLIGLD